MCISYTLCMFYIFFYDVEFSSYDLKHATNRTICYYGFGVNEQVLMLGQFCECHHISKTDATAETMAPP